MTIERLILGSTSPFRKHLLEAARVPFEARAPDFDEDTVGGTSASSIALLRAEGKALSLATNNPNSLIIGADQVLAFGGEVFDKVTTEAAAVAKLTQLSGKTHTLHSALVLVSADANGKAQVVSRTVTDAVLTMRSLDASEIKAYAATGEWQGSVGCYKLEQAGIQLFSSIEGEQSTIVGLPLTTLFRELRALGINLLTSPNPPWCLSRK